MHLSKTSTHALSLDNENVPSAGTERIDHIGMCHSGLWDAITSSSKTAVLVIMASQRDALFTISPHCTAAPVLQFRDITLVMSCTQPGTVQDFVS